LAFLVAVLGSGPAPRPLDPRDASPVGALALTRLLEHNGIHVTSVPYALDLDVSDPNTTIVVPAPELLTGDELSAIAEGTSDVMLVAPDPDMLTVFRVDATGFAEGIASHVTPQCDVPAAVAAGTVNVDGVLYRPSGSTVGCYPANNDGDTLLVST